MINNSTYPNQMRLPAGVPRAGHGSITISKPAAFETEPRPYASRFPPPGGLLASKPRNPQNF